MDQKFSNWSEFMEYAHSRPYFDKIMENLKREEDRGYIILPPSELIFNAFYQTPLENVKVVILGQDPYFSLFQAMGLAFSVPDGIKIPPSLRNIFKEIEDDLGIKCEDSGDLTRWARQGVFLLNATLTVREGQPNSHQDFGWSTYTDNVIKVLNSDESPKVFILWGQNARKTRGLITNKAHLILEAPHPSPLSAYRGFFGCKHFSQTNQFLKDNNLKEIDWR